MRKRSMQKFSIFILCFFVIAFSPTISFSDTTSDISNLLDRECINLKKEKLSNLILTGFSSDLQKGLDPDLHKISPLNNTLHDFMKVRVKTFLQIRRASS